MGSSSNSSALIVSSSCQGWSGTGLSGDENKSVVIPTGSTENRTYTANWSINSYRLDLIAGTGISKVTGAAVYQYGSNVSASCTMQTGYQFDSWSGDLATDTFTMPAGNATMTANAKPIDYVIEYDLAGGDLGTGQSNPVKYNVTSATITLINPTKEAPENSIIKEYEFLGWTGSGIDEGTASMTVTIPIGSTGNKNYVASWAVKVYCFNLSNTVTLEMRRCPPGTFMMGTPEGELGCLYNSGKPQHQVTLTKAFYIGKYEVTQDQFRAVDQSYPYSGNLPFSYTSYNELTNPNGGFISSINSKLASQIPTGYIFDLPTEAQWEYACRAGTKTSLNSGKNITATDSECLNLNDVGWYSFNSGDELHEVGLKTPNAWGLYDMHGNVFEICKDTSSQAYSSESVVDPLMEGSDGLTRGGAFNSIPAYCRSAARNAYWPNSPQTNYGVRLVLVPIE